MSYLKTFQKKCVNMKTSFPEWKYYWHIFGINLMYLWNMFDFLANIWHIVGNVLVKHIIDISLAYHWRATVNVFLIVTGEWLVQLGWGAKKRKTKFSGYAFRCQSNFSCPDCVSCLTFFGLLCCMSKVGPKTLEYCEKTHLLSKYDKVKRIQRQVSSWISKLWLV